MPLTVALETVLICNLEGMNRKSERIVEKSSTIMLQLSFTGVYVMEMGKIMP